MLETYLPAIRSTLAQNSILVLTAEPGTGKTTLIPPALLNEPWLGGSKILLLEPRRVATRAAASRMAFLHGEPPGKTFGWRMADDTRVGPSTRLEVITEGVLTRIIQSDPELSGVGLVIFDEYHERSLHADLGLALCLDVRKVLRPDLRLGVFSATLNLETVMNRLPGAVAVHAPGRLFPVTTVYRPAPGGTDPWAWVAQQVQEGWKAVSGSLLVFLPGGYEIRSVHSALAEAARREGESIELLYGGLSPEEQAKVLEGLPAGSRKTVLSTSVAETSVTIPGVELVIDAGWARLGRYDQGRALNRLVTEAVSQASADQRRGRAGRTGPGLCWRLWTEREALVPETDPEIRRADLGPLVLECAVWGVREVSGLPWMTEPSQPAWEAARTQLRSLEALDSGGAVTELGKAITRLGTGPRWGRMVLRAAPQQKRLAELIVELLEQRDRAVSTDPDVRARLAVAAQSNPEEVGGLLAWAYPDRIAFRAQTTGVSAQFQLPSGRMVRVRGALAAEETLVVAEADAGTAGVGTVWLAAPLGRGAARAVLGSLIEEVLEVEWAGWRPRVFRVRRWGALEFERTGLAVSDAKEAVLASLRHRLATDHRKLPWGQTSRQLLVRLSFVEADGPVDWGWLAEFADWSGLDLRSGPELYSEASLTRALAGQLPFQVRQQLESRAPESLVVPSGSRRKLEYREDGSEPGQFSVHMEVRIQEVFGLAASPRVAGVAVVLHLLSPGHKPLQITTDLASFWATTYQEVRKAMRGQYPRHYWPENPLEAEPTAKPRPKSSPQ